IPEQVDLKGTIRTFDEGNYEKLAAALQDAAEDIASAFNADATVTLTPTHPLTYNNERLAERSLPTLQRVAGKERVVVAPLLMPSEDFSYYSQEIPGLFLFFGVTPRGQDPKAAAPNHSPLFYVDESSLRLGVRTLSQL